MFPWILGSLTFACQALNVSVHLDWLPGSRVSYHSVMAGLSAWPRVIALLDDMAGAVYSGHFSLGFSQFMNTEA